MAEVEVMNRRLFSTHFSSPNPGGSGGGPSMVKSLSVLGSQVPGASRSRAVQNTRSCTNTTLSRTGTTPVENYLSQVNEIMDGLFLCGARALRPQRLAELGISCIFNVTIELPNLPLDKDQAKDVECIKIGIEDSPYANLGYYFDKVADKIDDSIRSSKKVLVHCVAGVSRSASLIIAYLIKHKGMTLRRAYQHVKGRRPIIRPNPGFFRQLIDFETRVHGKASVKMVWNAAAGGHIPDLYEPEYNNTLNFLNKYGCQGGVGTYTSWVNHFR